MFETLTSKLHQLADMPAALHNVLRDLNGIGRTVGAMAGTLRELVDRPYPVLVSVRGLALDSEQDRPATMGSALYLKPGQEGDVYFQPQEPLRNLSVECQGGWLLAVRLANIDELSPSASPWTAAATRVLCRNSCQVGNRISVRVRLPEFPVSPAHAEYGISNR